MLKSQTANSCRHNLSDGNWRAWAQEQEQETETETRKQRVRNSASCWSTANSKQSQTQQGLQSQWSEMTGRLNLLPRMLATC